jgi:hypothetical protein
MVRDKEVKICSIRDMPCYKKVEAKFEQNDFCECYQACGEIFYNFESQQMDFVR